MEYTSGIYLYNLDTESFLISHVTNTQGAYSIPKGRISIEDENAWVTATRELVEETSINLDDYEVKEIIELPPVKYTNDDVTLISFLVLIHFGAENINLECDSTFETPDGKVLPEVDGFKWVSIIEAGLYLPVSQTKNLPKIKKVIENLDKYILGFE